MSKTPAYGASDVTQTNRAQGEEVRQFVSFRVNNEDYAIDIMLVREIKGWTPTTGLPNQPAYVRGVLNLRGSIVPVFDLRQRFGLGATEVGPKHVVIIVTLKARLVGLLVDRVSDILTVLSSDIGPVPETESVSHTRFLQGIITRTEQMVVVLDLEPLFDAFTPAENPFSNNHDDMAA